MGTSMQVLLYNTLEQSKIGGFAKFKKAMEADDFTRADVKKVGDNLYRAKLNGKARLIFAIYQYQDKCSCLVLEYLPNHEYEKSRFLIGSSAIDENKLPTIERDQIIPEPAVYLNPQRAHFYFLDKVLSFDEQQQLIYDTPAPIVIIGSAGSGKTALTLEKMKKAVGDVLYVSHSAYLVQNSRNLYYANAYQNNDQEDVDFLSFTEYLESIQVPEGREVTRRDFERWFCRQRHKNLAAHKVFEEFRGVLTGPSLDEPWLNRQNYLLLGVRQSLFEQAQRPIVYDLFEKYLAFLNDNQLFDGNIISQQYLAKVTPRYDFVVVDEVQDITNTQLMLILKSLHQSGQFMLGGDANQIVHPNFFSWSKVKSLFFDQQDLQSADQALRILQANYRNSPLVAAVANRILKLKHARFGSVDKESNYLMRSVGEQTGQLQLLVDNDKVRQQLDESTSRSTKFAVVVMHAEQKAIAQQVFNTPLVFSIQEAKGLEYESIILFNFISNEQQIFNEIAKGVKVEDLDVDELKYARAKSKTDKSLETYKFYINALYVALTRAVSNLYIVEAQLEHPLMSLLDLSRFTGDLALQKQESSIEEWQQEAHKLALQGKQEQADDIRQRILKEKQVPWQPIDKAALAELKDKALQHGNKKAQLLLMEYSLMYQYQGHLNALRHAKFVAAIKAQKHESKAIKSIYKNHFILYDLKQPKGVLREINKYGVDHRTLFNLTPLMTAANVGNLPLVEVICESGPDKTLLAGNGLNAWQMLLSRLLLSPGEISQVGQLYRLLAPQAIAVQVDGRLEKLDDNSMFGFLLNVFFSLWYRHLPNQQIHRGGAVTAANLETMLATLPDSVLSPMKKQRSYISRYLSENEVDRDVPRNRKLFKRYKRGHYVLNPQLKIRQADRWYPLHDLLHFDGWSYAFPDYMLDHKLTNQWDLGYDLVKIGRAFDLQLDDFKRWIDEHKKR
jgi:hypothetical protein